LHSLTSAANALPSFCTLYFLKNEKKSIYLLSSSLRLTVPEKRWVEEHRATVTKLGTFYPGRNFAPLRTNMVRKQKSVDQSNRDESVDAGCIPGYLREIKATFGSLFLLRAVTMSEDPCWSQARPMFPLVSSGANVSPL